MIKSLSSLFCSRLAKQTLTKGLQGSVARTFMAGQNPLFFRLTPFLGAEPLKKKRRLDPAVIRAREERRKKKIEKQIRKLEKGARQLKPIDENEVPEAIFNDIKGERVRRDAKLTREEEKEERELLKEWTIYKMRQNLVDAQMIDRILLSQQWALDNLQQESEFLYKAAVQVDESLVPFVSQGPFETPPIENYDTPDGEYIDISKNWEQGI